MRAVILFVFLVFSSHGFCSSFFILNTTQRYIDVVVTLHPSGQELPCFVGANETFELEFPFGTTSYSVYAHSSYEDAESEFGPLPWNDLQDRQMAVIASFGVMATPIVDIHRLDRSKLLICAVSGAVLGFLVFLPLTHRM